ncbi:hypothetical protein FQN50_005651 [Emmonsiellopsis sp. PD_5]|nr:hypothetical protein FQN50_005651 [Emmonsiellopsis sp. PD_5]
MARTYTAYNVRLILILTLGSLTFGYSFSVISNTLGQPGFLQYFNLEASGPRNNVITGTINGLFCAGATFGALTVGWMSEAHGRKVTMYTACAVNIFGGSLQTGSINLGMFLASRFIAGWGIGMMVVLIPIYQAEICEILPFANTGIIGYIDLSHSAARCARPSISNLPPLALAICTPWVPESPRWLLTRDRKDEAWETVSKLHGNDETYARKEFYQMVQQVQSDSAAWAQGGNKQLFTKPSYRKRMWMGFFIQYAAQTTGAQVIYSEFGSLTGGTPLILSAVYVTVATISNFVGALLLDRFGRKPLLITGLAGCMISLSLETAMIAQFAGTTNRAGNAMGVFFTFCFISFYGGGIDAPGYVYCSEIFPTHIRSQGVAWSLVGTFLSTLVYVEAAPTALANIEWKYYLIFVVLTFVNIVILYFWCPETKGLSLEDINGKFGDEVIVHFADATEVEKSNLAAAVKAEDGISRVSSVNGPDKTTATEAKPVEKDSSISVEA